jgi:hypothetical protein
MVKHRQLLGAFLIVDSFAQYSKGDHKQVILDVTAVTKYWPRKMLNRGMLSIFQKSVYSLARQSSRRAF